MRRTSIPARCVSGSSIQLWPDPKTMRSVANAGNAGHAHGPYQEKIVIPMPAKALMNERDTSYSLPQRVSSRASRPQLKR